MHRAGQYIFQLMQFLLLYLDDGVHLPLLPSLLNQVLGKLNVKLHRQLLQDSLFPLQVVPHISIPHQGSATHDCLARYRTERFYLLNSDLIRARNGKR